MSEQIRPRLSGAKQTNYNFFNRNEDRILVIGDLHEPFSLDAYLYFCKESYERFNCNKVVFIGDVIDNHYASYHETDADGMGGADELDLSIGRLQRYYSEWPDADVLLGNHDRMVARKARTSNVPSRWIREYKDVLETPNWKFVDRVVYDDVQYVHGEGGTARTKCRADMMNTVQGHLHTQAYCEHYVGERYRVFGMQVGCGIDFDRYSFDYAKRGKKPAIGCGVVIGGHTPINILMKL